MLSSAGAQIPEHADSDTGYAPVYFVLERNVSELCVCVRVCLYLYVYKLEQKMSEVCVCVLQTHTHTHL